MPYVRQNIERIASRLHRVLKHELLTGKLIIIILNNYIVKVLLIDMSLSNSNTANPFENSLQYLFSCWMSVYGGDAWYFGAPVLILVLVSYQLLFQ